jgi:Cu-Zn family superoxide dismutase
MEETTRRSAWVREILWEKLKMRSVHFFALIAASLLCAPAAAGGKTATSELINNQGERVGTLTLTQGTAGVLITLRVSGLPPGYHGMHFHAMADCSDHAAFKKAGGHVDPHKKPHGFLHPGGPHEGNLPNLIVDQGGKAELELYTQMVSLEQDPAKLLDEDGSSLIIHANRDDHRSQPIGGSGDRIACAAVK